jgi:hypothetical protein
MTVVWDNKDGCGVLASRWSMEKERKKSAYEVVFILDWQCNYATANEAPLVQLGLSSLETTYSGSNDDCAGSGAAGTVSLIASSAIGCGERRNKWVEE